MSQTLLYALAGLAFGSAVAFLNSRITKKLVLDEEDSLSPEKRGVVRVMLVNFLRLLISAAALFLVFEICKKLHYPMIPSMIGTAVGLTAVSFLFLWFLVRRSK